jgi:predicted RNase H-like HicB family nuclease
MNRLVNKIISGHDLTFNLAFQRDEESGWFVVHVVELPGCVSQGATVDEAKVNIVNALESYMEVLPKTAIRNQATPGASIPVESSVSQTTKMLVRPKFEVHARVPRVSLRPAACERARARKVFERKLGCECRKNAEHIILVSPAGQVISIPNHAEVRRPTLKQALRTCGIGDKEY